MGCPYIFDVLFRAGAGQPAVFATLFVELRKKLGEPTFEEFSRALIALSGGIGQG